MTFKIAAVAVLATTSIALVGCSTISDEVDDITASTTPGPSESFNQKAPLLVKASQFEAQWPFTVDEGVIHCSGDAAWFRTGDKNYPLNSVAQSGGGGSVKNPQSSLQPILKSPGAKDPLTGNRGEYADAYPIVQEGDNMCGAV